MTTVIHEMNFPLSRDGITGVTTVAVGASGLDSPSRSSAPLRLESRSGVDTAVPDIDPLASPRLGGFGGEVLRRGAKA
ncbi:acyl carrier protein [Streptomyces sp. NPDC057438]|uniref:acyl carrier protein n=1 Tax=Streptomyces sp. NPDC057438 TaxID=3346133 RepID=UPI00369B9397